MSVVTGTSMCSASRIALSSAFAPFNTRSAGIDTLISS